MTVLGRDDEHTLAIERHGRALLEQGLIARLPDLDRLFYPGRAAWPAG